LSRPLFIQAGRLTRWNGWSPTLHLLSPEGDSSNCDIVSQERLAALLRDTGAGGRAQPGCSPRGPVSVGEPRSTAPGPPQIRTCGITASGSSAHGLATRGERGWKAEARAAGSDPAAVPSPSS